MNIDFYNYAVAIVGQVPVTSAWLYDIATLLLIILCFAFFLAIPIFLIVKVASR